MEPVDREGFQREAQRRGNVPGRLAGAGWGMTLGRPTEPHRKTKLDTGREGEGGEGEGGGE
jgi:hypothetical protein